MHAPLSGDASVPTVRVEMVNGPHELPQFGAPPLQTLVRGGSEQEMAGGRGHSGALVTASTESSSRVGVTDVEAGIKMQQGKIPAGFEGDPKAEPMAVEQALTISQHPDAPAPAKQSKTEAFKAKYSALKPFVIISLSYLLFTTTDGAVRMIVLLHAYNSGFTAW